MFSLFWALLLPLVLGKTVKVDITKDTPGTQWSSGWSSIAGSRYFGGTLMSVGDAGATLTYLFTGTTISVYGIEGTSSSSRANSSYTLDGSTPRLHQDSTTTATSNVLFYTSPLLEDTQHTLVIQNLAAGGELQLDYFEVIRSTVHDGESIPTFRSSPRSIHARNEPLQPAVIAGLTLASIAVVLGFISLFVLWRREYARGRRGKAETHPRIQLQSQDEAQKVPFLNERVRIAPFTSTSVSSQPSQALRPSQPSQSLRPSQPSQTSITITPVAMTVTPAHPLPSREQVVATSSSRRNEKRLPPTGPVYTMESISRLNLGLDANPRNHSVFGQPSNYESEASENPRHQQNRENDSGVSLLGSSETINPKALRLPPGYRQFYP